MTDGADGVAGTSPRPGAPRARSDRDPQGGTGVGNIVSLDADAAPERTLLAVDAGLRAGLALYGADGRLREYRSTNFGSVARLKRGVYSVMARLPQLTHLVVEGGGGGIAAPWLKEGRRRELEVRQVQARTWRELLLLPRTRRSGADAKEEALALARRVVTWSGAAKPTSLRHDAAEAVLIGLWGVLQAGWLDDSPRWLS